MKLEIVRATNMFRVPEWVQVLLYTISLCALCFALFAYTIQRERVVKYSQAKPSVYVVAHNQYMNLDGSTIWSLEYTVNGEMQIPANFKTEKQMIEFEQYLYRVGERAK